MMNSEDENEENDDSTSSRDPLNVQEQAPPPSPGAPPAYASSRNPPAYQEALGLLSPGAAAINDGDPPPEYIELSDVRPRVGSAASTSVNGSHSSIPEVRIVDPADAEASVAEGEEEQETYVDVDSTADQTEEVPANDVANVESGSEGRRQQIQEFIDRIKQRRKFLIIFPLVLVAIVIFMATFPVSFHYIHYYDIALKRSKVTGWVDFSKVYHSGCYVIGPEMEFLHFESTAQTIDLNLNVVSSSSLAYNVRLFVVYRLRPSEFPQLYRKFAGLHEDVLKKAIINAAKNRAVSIHVDSWMSDRRNMERELEKAVVNALNSTYHVNVINVYLIGIQFPRALLVRLMAQEELILKSATEEYKLTERVEHMKTNQATNDVMNSANEIAEASKAKSNYIDRVANADGSLEITKTLAKSLLDLKNGIPLATNDELMSAHWFATLRKLAKSKRLVVTEANSTSSLYREPSDGSSFVDSIMAAAAASASFPNP